MRQTKNIYEHLEKQDIIPILQRKGNYKAYIKLSLTPLCMPVTIFVKSIFYSKNKVQNYDKH